MELLLRVRETTDALVRPLAVEDFGVQSMPDASPTKWHLAHTTWFLEELVLPGLDPSYEPFRAAYRYLFNSYYESIGARQPRHARGMLSRPTVDEVRAYRAHVNGRLRELEAKTDEARFAVTLAAHHEQQHQELILTDLQHAFATQPLRPAYLPAARAASQAPSGDLAWLAFDGGVREIGHGSRDFAFDNETPRHRVYVEPFQMASRLVTNGEYLAFVEDGGYRRPELWLSDGWAFLANEGVSLPMHWRRETNGEVVAYDLLGGEAPLRRERPVTHVSLYEADAYARWAKARLLSEAEWEVAASERAIEGTFLEGSGLLGPRDDAPRAAQMFGEAWQWTQSAYLPYPGFRAFEGSFGEYNGKFMSSQMVLRGGSRLTPRSHFRITYRNFFPPSARWQVTGIRLGRDR